jgi:hypothetical protein
MKTNMYRLNAVKGLAIHSTKELGAKRVGEMRKKMVSLLSSSFRRAYTKAPPPTAPRVPYPVYNARVKKVQVEEYG